MLDIVLSVEEGSVHAQGHIKDTWTRKHTFSPACSIDTLDKFTSAVHRAAQFGKAFDAALLKQAHMLHEELFQGELRDAVTKVAAQTHEPPLVRLITDDVRLQRVPWEALCKPGTSEGFLATGSRLHVVRGVTSTRSVEARKVEGALQLLVIAPQGASYADILKSALQSSLESHDIEWLEPLCGVDASAARMFERLRRNNPPNIIHFIGHGGMDREGHPTLRLADDEDNQEVWLRAESLAEELQASLGADLRLIVLESCEGAAPGAFGSAAEFFIRAGVDAVVSYLWPVRAAIARTASTAFYSTLTSEKAVRGNVVASVAAARRTLRSVGELAFSLVTHLAGVSPTIFDLVGKADPVEPSLHGPLVRPNAQTNITKPEPLAVHGGRLPLIDTQLLPKEHNERTEVTSPSQIARFGGAPMRIIQAAIEAVPAVRYALGVAGLGAAIALAASVVDLPKAFLGIPVMFAFMVALVVFGAVAKMGPEALRMPARIFCWFFMLLLMGLSTILFTAFAFQWPRPLRELLALGIGPERTLQPTDQATIVGAMPAISTDPKSLTSSPAVSPKCAPDAASSACKDWDDVGCVCRSCKFKLAESNEPLGLRSSAVECRMMHTGANANVRALFRVRRDPENDLHLNTSSAIALCIGDADRCKSQAIQSRPGIEFEYDVVVHDVTVPESKTILAYLRRNDCRVYPDKSCQLRIISGSIEVSIAGPMKDGEAKTTPAPGMLANTPTGSKSAAPASVLPQTNSNVAPRCRTDSIKTQVKGSMKMVAGGDCEGHAPTAAQASHFPQGVSVPFTLSDGTNCICDLL